MVREVATHLDREMIREEREREIVRRVRAAVAAGIEVVFQPIVELATRRPIGVEALARFPDGAQPEVWLEQAATVGLRPELELAALRSALASLERLPDHLFLSVNVSPSVLDSREAIEILAQAPLERLVIETTEHAPVEDYEALRRALQELRASGLRLAVDDAGAGFASLRHVVQLAPDMIKIDRSLVAEVERDAAARALASALVAFASEMGQLVIAEGIESEASLAALVALGIGHGQGYAIARPGPLPLPT